MKKLILLSLVFALNFALNALNIGALDVHADTLPSEPLTVNAPNNPDFVLFSVVKIKPESILDFKNAVLPYAAQTRLEDGCVEYRVHQSPDDATQFETYEHWKSDDARNVHLAAPHTVQFFQTTTPYFETGYPIRTKFIELR